MSEKTKEKTCVFYVSDYHFEMISLPFIERNLESKKEVIVLTENDLEDTIKVLLSKVNLKDEKKKNLSKINWSQNNQIKFKQIKNNIENNKEIVIFIKGKEDYIKNINKKLDKLIKNNDNTKIIDCYNLNDVNGNLSRIMSSYKNMLNTSGEINVENL